MYVVLSGAGEVGFHVARALREEGHSVAILERDPRSIARARNLDALVIEGNGASLDRLLEAEIEKADLFIGATGHDEVNMVGCAIAKAYGVRTVARINSGDYIDEPATQKYRSIGIDVAVCPELVAALKVFRVLTTPALVNLDVFADGRVGVVEARVDPASEVAGKRIREIEMPRGVNLLAIFRDEEVVIPKGEEQLRPYDRVLLAMLQPDAIRDVERIIGRPQRTGFGTTKVHKVMIAGATRIGVHLAKLLEAGHEVVVVDEDKARCERATHELEKSLVINANATDRSVLMEEDIESFDAFVGANPVEEYNILACLIAKKMGVRKTIALLNQPELKDLAEAAGIDLTITPRHATVGTMLRWTHQSETLDLVMTRSGDTQLLELKVHEDSKVAGKPLKKANLPQGALIGAIVRGDEVILPRGDDTLVPGDRVVVFATTDAVGKLEKLF